MSIAELKARSRLALHRHLARSASFYQTSGTPSPTTLDVRTFYQGKRVGDLAGTNLSYAERLEHPTELVLWSEDVSTAGLEVDRGNIVIFDSEEGYYVDVAHPRDGQTQKVEVSPIKPSDLVGRVLPDGTTVGS